MQPDGNIRELKNAITASYPICKNNVIEKEDLNFEHLSNNKSMDEFIKAAQEQEIDILRKKIKSALVKNKGNKTKTAKELGMTRQNLYYLIKKKKI